MKLDTGSRCDPFADMLTRTSALRCRLKQEGRALQGRATAAQPRYDDVFYEGLDWLDENGQ